ncbi:MAG TPA: hypothetical protein PLB25_10290, partial [Rhodoferax sp.]|nr:hypothetical protein [Rhodoferax sp.]
MQKNLLSAAPPTNRLQRSESVKMVGFRKAQCHDFCCRAATDRDQHHEQSALSVTTVQFRLMPAASAQSAPLDVVRNNFPYLHRRIWAHS